jgi:hypothetical protein
MLIVNIIIEKIIIVQKKGMCGNKNEITFPIRIFQKLVKANYVYPLNCM